MNKRTLIILSNKSYRMGTPIMSDDEYDKLLEEYKKENPDDVMFESGVIEEAPKERAAKLPLPMYSLDKFKTIKELNAWLKKRSLTTEYIITPKLDGLSLLVDEVNKTAITRGDGITGQMVTPWVLKQIDFDPEFSKYSWGEIIIFKSVFKKIVQPATSYKHPRNAVAGLLRAEEERDSMKTLKYLRYGGNAKKDKINFVNDIPHILITGAELIDATSFIRNLYFDWKETYDVEIDGLVIDINDHELREQLGREVNMNPKYAKALKFNFETTHRTHIIDIKYQVSKEGYLNPVLQIEPVIINGASISAVTGYNAKYLEDHGLGNNAVIDIILSGEIIPKHVNTVMPVTPKLPTVCPSCKEPVYFNDNNIELVCVNENCPEKVINTIVHYLTTIGVKGYKYKAVKRIYEALNIHTLPELYNIRAKFLAKIEGFNTKSAESFVQQLRDKRTLEFAVFSDATSAFKHLGTRKLRWIGNAILDNPDYILEQFIELRDMYNQYNKIPEHIYEALINTEGIGEETIRTFFTGLTDFIIIYSSMNVNLTLPETKEVNAEGVLFGNTYVFSGFRDKELEQIIIDHGGLMASSVSKKVTHLVVKDPSAKTSKIAKAEKLGIHIIALKEFKDELSDH